VVNAAEERHRPARRGFLILAALTGAALAITFADAIVNRTRGMLELNAIFAEAGGLRPGSEVWLGGYPVGKVTSIAFLPPSADTLARVIARLELPGQYREQLRRDSEVGLASPSLLAPPAVNISPGTAGAPRLGNGDTLRARREAPAEAVQEKAAELRPQVAALLASFDTVLQEVQERRPALDRLTRGGDLARAELRQLAADLERSPLFTGLNDPALRLEVERIAARSRSVAAGVQQRVAELAGEEDGSVRSALAGLAARADTLALRAEELQETMRLSGGFPARLAEDEALLVALRRVREELDSVIAATLRNPLRYFF
jgi:phospholipid/cholesterol/gamma-HCH transport system substrate-binding protein